MPDRKPLASVFQQGLYSPDFVRNPEDIANPIVEDVVPNTEIKKPTTPGSSSDVPLTEEEALAVDKEIEDTLERIQNTREVIKATKTKIDSLVNLHSNNEELVFELDISKKPRIKRAIRKVFGMNTNTITYSMYKELLKAKNQLEKEQGQGYVKGFE